MVCGVDSLTQLFIRSAVQVFLHPVEWAGFPGMPWRRRVLLETGEEVWLSSPLLLLYLTLQLKTGLVWEVHFFPLLSYFSVADKKKKKPKQPK